MRQLLWSAVMFSSLAYAQTAVALDPLLVQFGWSQPNSVTLPATYVAIVNSASWSASNSNDINAFPTTQSATSGAILNWNQQCAAGTFCLVGFSNGGQQPFSSSADQDLDRILGGPNRLWADGWDGNSQPFPSGFTGTFHAATYVPQKGNGHQALYGYKITAVEREITSTTQTIRLYGVDAPIPEPSTLLLMLLGLGAHLSIRRPLPSRRQFQ